MNTKRPSLEQEFKDAKQHWNNFHRDAGIFYEGMKQTGSIRIVGISGKAGAGKSTLCQEMARQLNITDPKIISFAAPLKRIALSMGWDGIKDASGRKLLQLLGTECARDCISETIWLEHWTMEVFRARDTEVVFTDDMRFPNEVEHVSSLHGIKVKIVGRDEIASGADHPSEQVIDDSEYDYVIDNDGSAKDLASKVTVMLKDLQWIS